MKRHCAIYSFGSLYVAIAVGINLIGWAFPIAPPAIAQSTTRPTSSRLTLENPASDNPASESAADESSNFRPIEAQPLPPSDGDATSVREASIQAEIRAIRGELIHLLGRLEILESQLAGDRISVTSPQQVEEADPTISDANDSEDSDVSNTDGFVTLDPELTPPPQLRLGTQTISLPGDVLFAFNQSEIQPEAASLLEQVASILEAMPFAHIQVAGHTDNIGDPEYNLILSVERATAVQEFLMEVLPESGQGYRWTATGHGEAAPVAENDTEAGRQRNRRVDLIVSPQ